MAWRARSVFCPGGEGNGATADDGVEVGDDDGDALGLLDFDVAIGFGMDAGAALGLRLPGYSSGLLGCREGGLLLLEEKEGASGRVIGRASAQAGWWLVRARARAEIAIRAEVFTGGFADG